MICQLIKTYLAATHYMLILHDQSLPALASMSKLIIRHSTSTDRTIDSPPIKIFMDRGGGVGRWWGGIPSSLGWRKVSLGPLLELKESSGSIQVHRLYMVGSLNHAWAHENITPTNSCPHYIWGIARSQSQRKKVLKDGKEEWPEARPEGSH